MKEQEFPIGPRELLGRLLDHAERYAALSKEPDDAPCREAVRKGQIWFESGSATIDIRAVGRELTDYVERSALTHGHPEGGLFERMLREAKVAYQTGMSPHAKEPSRESLADLELEGYDFGDGVRVVDQGTWDHDDPEDLNKVVYVEFDNDPPGASSHRISFHVRFSTAGQVTEAYGLTMDGGSEIGHRPCTVDLPCSRDGAGEEPTSAGATPAELERDLKAGRRSSDAIENLYRVRESLLATYASQKSIGAADIRRLDRLGRAAVASDHWALCDEPCRQALLADIHHAVRSCATISAQRAQSTLSNELETGK